MKNLTVAGLGVTQHEGGAQGVRFAIGSAMAVLGLDALDELSATHRQTRGRLASSLTWPLAQGGVDPLCVGRTSRAKCHAKRLGQGRTVDDTTARRRALNLVIPAAVPRCR